MKNLTVSAPLAMALSIGLLTLLPSRAIKTRRLSPIRQCPRPRPPEQSPAA